MAKPVWKKGLLLAALLLLGCGAAEKLISELIPPIDVPIAEGLASGLPQDSLLPMVDGFVFVPIRSRQEGALQARILDDPDDKPEGYRVAANAQVSIVQGGEGSALTDEQGYFFIPLGGSSRQAGTTVRLSVTYAGQVYEAEHTTSHAFTIPPERQLLKTVLDTSNERFQEAVQQDVTKLEWFKFHLVVQNLADQDAHVRLAVSRRDDHSTWGAVAADTTDSRVVLDLTIPSGPAQVVHEFYRPSQNAEIFEFVKQLVYGEQRMVVYYQSDFPGELKVHNVFVEAKFGVEL